MALAHWILGKFLREVCHCFPPPLNVPTFAARCLYVRNDARDPSSERWNCGIVVLCDLIVTGTVWSFWQRRWLKVHPRYVVRTGVGPVVTRVLEAAGKCFRNTGTCTVYQPTQRCIREHSVFNIVPSQRPSWTYVGRRQEFGKRNSHVIRLLSTEPFCVNYFLW
jgi:hypothetical protein